MYFYSDGQHLLLIFYDIYMYYIQAVVTKLVMDCLCRLDLKTKVAK